MNDVDDARWIERIYDLQIVARFDLSPRDELVVAVLARESAERMIDDPLR